MTAAAPRPDIAREWALLALLALFWGSSYLMIGIAVAEIPPVTLIAARVGIAALVLTAIAAWQGHRAPRGAPIWGRLVLQSFLNSFGAWTLLAWGQQHTESGLAGVLNSTSPLFVVLIGVASVRPPPGRAVLGALIGLGGVVLIMGPGALAGLGRETVAEAAVLAGAFLYALAALHGRHLGHLPPVVTAAGTMWVATAVLVPASLIRDAPASLAPSAAAIAATLSLGLFSTAFALMLYFRLIRTLGPLGTASQAYLRAGIAVALGMVVLGEAFAPATALGIVLALAGVVLINWPGRRSR